MTPNGSTVVVVTSWEILEEKNDIIVNEKQFQIIIMVYIVVTLCLTCVGSLTNVFTMKTFLAIGLKDGVSVSLFALSATDCLYCAASLMVATTWIFRELEIEHGFVYPVNPFVVTMFTGDIALAFYAATTMTTVFLAVARCMCVAQPLHFKNAFTRSRSIVIHISFIVFVIACYTPVLSQMGTRRRHDRIVNATRVVLWFSDIREDIKDIVFLVYDVIFTFVTHFIVIVCMMVMAECLRKSSNFRRAISKTKTDDDGNESSYKLSGKELQVVKQVVLISSMYIVCSLPKMFIAVYSLVEPEFDVGKRHQYFYLSSIFLRNNFEVINSGSTFFIYYNYNSAFRNHWSSITKTPK